MLEPFYPKEYVASAYDIDYEARRAGGCAGVIFDVDNTLVPHGAPADERAKALFERLHKLGYKILLLSNNKEPRVRSFCQEVVGAEYIYKAGKPNPEGYRKAMERMGTDPEHTLFVGDQIFTDVWGANRAGIYTILVKPIHPKEEIQIVLKRYLERIVLYFYQRRKKHEGSNRK
jgi:HAD superfamily phosphatase (TIGR01668 family)